MIVRKPRTEPQLSETRHSARIRTGGAHTPIEAKSTPVTTPRSKPAVRRTLTQAELMAEAAITEEWNKADLEAYVRYTQLSDKEKAELEKKRTTHGVSQSSAAAGEYRIISRSFGGTKSEIRIESPIRTKNVLSRDVKSTTTMEILGQTPSSLSTTTKNAMNVSKYRHPTTLETFNTCEEFSKIESKIRTTEKRKIEKLILNLSSLLQVKNV